jgi:hypothetical protein
MSSQATEFCAICRGAKEEHGPGKTQHVYTTTPGELKSTQQAEQEKQRQQMSGSPRVVALPTGGDSQAVSRLLELLMSKGLISLEEAYTVATGTRPPTRQFVDPARLFE